MNRDLATALASYPLLIPRLYNYLRLGILPLLDIAEAVPQFGKVLDVGCGYGLLDIYLAKTSSQRYVIGSELNSKRVRVAKQAACGIENVEFVQEDLLRGQHVGDINCAILVDLLHHISYERQQALIAAIWEALAVGGTLIVKDMDDRPAFKYYINLVHDKLMTGFDKLSFISAGKLRANLAARGFVVHSCRTLPHPFYAHYLLTCKKADSNLSSRDVVHLQEVEG
ncbi:class I SAM-dependent methyltransferase [Rubidibacter lacunae]|nr:class I SAM-dependent methyltransferase [Rubidibacter lacunae]